MGKVIRRAITALSSCFLLGAVINWIYIYKLGKWDPKFGGEWDNFLLALQIVAILAFLTAIGVATGSAFLYRRVSTQSVSHAYLAGAVIGLANGLLYWSNATVYVARWFSLLLPRHTVLDLGLSAVVLAILLVFLEVPLKRSYDLFRGAKVND